MATAPPAKRPLAPQYWPSWLVAGLVYCLAWLPMRLQPRLGAWLGRLTLRIIGRRAHIARCNLRACFPQDDDAAIEARLRAHFEAIGRGLLETTAAWWKPSRHIAPHLRVEGIEHLHAAQREGGVILLTGHFTTLEIAARALCEAGVAFHAMYRPLNNRVFDYCVTRMRTKRARRTAVPRDDLRQLLRVLRKGEAIWYAPDQTLSREAVFVDFCGVPTLTLTATAKLAKAGRAKVVPFFARREGSDIVVRVLPAWQDFPSGDDAADARRVNAAIEEGVALAPHDYFWVHRRFKLRPPGASPIY